MTTSNQFKNLSLHACMTFTVWHLLTEVRLLFWLLQSWTTIKTQHRSRDTNGHSKLLLYRSSSQRVSHTRKTIRIWPTQCDKRLQQKKSPSTSKLRSFAFPKHNYPIRIPEPDWDVSCSWTWREKAWWSSCVSNAVSFMSKPKSAGNLSFSLRYSRQVTATAR